MTKNKDKKHVEQPVENQVEKETVETVNNGETVNDGEAATADLFYLIYCILQFLNQLLFDNLQ